jgi:Flp pilus assembly protein TadD
MRWRKKQQWLKRRGLALRCVLFTCVAFCGCQAAPFERLEATSTASAGGQLPKIESAQSHAAANAATPSHPAEAEVVQAHSSDDAAIAENLNCGHREAALNHYELAEKCYRKVLALSPDHPMANHRLAVLADRRGDFSTSERCYLKALNREPNNADALSDLGYSYFLQGRNAESETYLLAALRANSLHQKALDNLSLLYVKIGDRDRALETLKRSLSESEALARMAELLPREHGSAADDETITASFAPFQSGALADRNAGTPVQKLATAGENAQRTSSPSIPETGQAPQGQPLLEKQLADLMDRERKQALEKRTRQQKTNPQFATSALATPSSESSAASAWDSPAPSSVPTRSSAVPDAGLANKAESTTGAVGRVPDERINDVFAAIDREGDNSGSARSQASVSPAGDPGASQSIPAPLREGPDRPRGPVTGAAPAGLSPNNTCVPSAAAANDSEDWESISTAVAVGTIDKRGLSTSCNAPASSSDPRHSNGPSGTANATISASWATNGFDSQPPQSPRILAIGVEPTTNGGDERTRAPRAPDALDEFEAEIQKKQAKKEARIIPGRSSSNAAAAAKQPAQWLTDLQRRTDKDASGDSGQNADNPWSPRIQPRRNLPPLFAPDRSSVSEKRPVGDKPDPFDAGTNWSDVPAWSAAPVPASSRSNGNNGPLIRPGSF